ncbi:hypothetical protein GCM10025860_08590 [Methanobacterium ferruginis]|nr:hypothetical protein GCM10025860_08590 [Methanobacterium ferruginis]
MFFSVKKKQRHYMERKNLIELSEMQRYKEENKNYQKENERLREFSLELLRKVLS